MAKPYIDRPEPAILIRHIAEFISRQYRLRVTITIDDLSGSQSTVELGHPDKD